MYHTRFHYPLTADFTIGDFTIDGEWHKLSLASIVPAGASAVNLHAKVVASAIADTSTLYIRPVGEEAWTATCTARAQVINVHAGAQFVRGLNDLREIEYRIIAAGNLTLCRLTIWGWWLP